MANVNEKRSPNLVPLGSATNPKGRWASVLPTKRKAYRELERPGA